MNKQIESEGLHLAYELGKADGIKQGRVDAIDEFVKRINEHFHDGITLYKLEYIAEQLKEKNECG